MDNLNGQNFVASPAPKSSKRWMWIAGIGNFFLVVLVVLLFWRIFLSSADLDLSNPRYYYILSPSLQVGLAMLSLWSSLYFGNKIKIVFHDRGTNVVVSFFIVFMVVMVSFLLLYVVLPLPLIDNRDAGGMPGFIDFESIGHLGLGFVVLIYLFFGSLFL